MSDSKRAANIPVERLKQSRALAFVTTALILYAASLFLPFATAEKFGERHSGYLLSGVVSLWEQGQWMLSLLVLGCGVLAPLLLVTSLARLLLASRAERPRPDLRRWLHLGARLEQWSMPEVQLLGVIVAFIKLSSLITSHPGPGLWCYGLAACFTLLASHTFDAHGVATVLLPASEEGRP